MESPAPDYTQVDIILKSHSRRLNEAITLCERSIFFRARPSPKEILAAVSSSPKKSPTINKNTAVKTGTYISAIKLYEKVKSFSQVESSLEIPSSTLRDALKRDEVFGSPEPRKRGRKMLSINCRTQGPSPVQDLKPF